MPLRGLSIRIKIIVCALTLLVSNLLLGHVDGYILFRSWARHLMIGHTHCRSLEGVPGGYPYKHKSTHFWELELVPSGQGRDTADHSIASEVQDVTLTD